MSKSNKLSENSLQRLYTIPIHQLSNKNLEILMQAIYDNRLKTSIEDFFEKNPTFAAHYLRKLIELMKKKCPNIDILGNQNTNKTKTNSNTSSHKKNRTVRKNTPKMNNNKNTPNTNNNTTKKNNKNTSNTNNKNTPKMNNNKNTPNMNKNTTNNSVKTGGKRLSKKSKKSSKKSSRKRLKKIKS